MKQIVSMFKRLGMEPAIRLARGSGEFTALQGTLLVEGHLEGKEPVVDRVTDSSVGWTWERP